MLKRIVFAAMLVVTAVISPAVASDLTIVTFNVESDDDTDPAIVAQDMERVGKGVDLWALVEVQDKDAANTFRQAAERATGHKFRYILGTSGRLDRLAILYNLDTMRHRDTEELSKLPGSRKPLVAAFRHKGSGQELLFVVNHFNRGDAGRRQRQADEMRKWTERQKLPVILAGDYNFDFDPKGMKGNRAFDIFMQGQTMRWLEPECVARGNCPRTGTGCDGRHNSILDFVFIAGSARDWLGLAEIQLRERAYCAGDRRGHADHRPVLTVLDLPSAE